MRVLLTSPAGAGHVNQMVPLAQALSARGHDVLWAVPPRGVAAVEQAGIRTVECPSVPTTTPAELMQRYPELRDLPPVEVPDFMFSKLFGAVMAPAMLADVAPVALDWGPDLVVSDVSELAGPIVAAELGVPGVTKAFGALLPVQRLERAAAEVAPLWKSRGLDPRPYAGCYDHLYLDIYPPDLQSQTAEHVPHRQPMRPVSYSGPLDESAPLPLPEDRPDSPLVYVTMGTVFNNTELFGGIVPALAELDVRVLVTVGPQGDPDALGDHPPHVRVERYVPQSAVLPLCDVVVSHAGSGTALATLELGLPQLCLPQGADQFLNAAAIATAGAGLSLLPGDATVEAIGSAVSQLLAEQRFRDAAGRTGRGIAAMPSPDDVVTVLEALASKG
jgi:UDP:flavonoid glycosyltransferase YjiC (YdhE family)